MIKLVLLMGGEGTRTFLSIPKQYTNINDKYIFQYTVESFLDFNEIDEYIFVLNNEYQDLVKEVLDKNYPSLKYSFAKAGTSRSESFKNALKIINETSSTDTNIMVHDVARPLVTKNIIKNHIEALKNNLVSTTFLNINDSLVKKEYKLENRDEYFLLQTPQSFPLKIINEALKIKNNYDSEEISLINDTINSKINLIEGNFFNFKITAHYDFLLFVSILMKYYEFRDKLQ